MFVLLGVAGLQAENIDFTDINSPKVKCEYQKNDDGVWIEGIIDYGPTNPESHHTVCTDKSAWDENVLHKLDSVLVLFGGTDTQKTTHSPIHKIRPLRTIPPNATASVKLGNRDGWDPVSAERITYEFEVEAAKPLLVFNYAAVMENPGHGYEYQPRMTLEILDDKGDIIDATCGGFDFVASLALGWGMNCDTIWETKKTDKTYNFYETTKDMEWAFSTTCNNYLLWKDWTAVGLNLKDYAGKKVKIRITTYDCKASAHGAYIYYTIEQTQNHIKSFSCDAASTAVFVAPDGFEYQWYTKDGANKTLLGTERQIRVTPDEKTYFCDVNQVGKPTCKFELEARYEPQYPLAKFDYDIRCGDTLVLTNLSSLSSDGINPKMPLEDAEGYIWDLGDGRIINTQDRDLPPITYDKTGTYTIKLTSLWSGGCTHTTEQTISIKSGRSRVVETSDEICDGEKYLFRGRTLTKAGTYYDTLRMADGCDSFYIFHLTVWPIYKPVARRTSVTERVFSVGNRLNSVKPLRDGAVNATGRVFSVGNRLNSVKPLRDGAGNATERVFSVGKGGDGMLGADFGSRVYPLVAEPVSKSAKAVRNLIRVEQWF